MDEHGQEWRLVACGHQNQIHEGDHHCRDKRRVNQVRGYGFDEVCFGRVGLQMEFAGEGRVDFGDGNDNPDGEAHDKANDEACQKSHNDGAHGHLGRMFG